MPRALLQSKIGNLADWLYLSVDATLWWLGFNRGVVQPLQSHTSDFKSMETLQHISTICMYLYRSDLQI